jgi:4-oxalocrotonate tautomerase
MPVIRVEMFKRTQEQKKQLVKGLTEAFVNTCGGDKEAIKILITDVKESNWSSGGVLTSDKKN